MSPTIEEGLVAYLAGLSTITDLIGVGADMRLYPIGGVPDDSDTPYLTYRKISGPRDDTHDSGTDLAHPRFQISAWDPTYLKAKQLALAVVKSLRSFRGTLGGVPRVATNVDNEVDLFHPDERIKQVAVDVVMWHSES